MRYFKNYINVIGEFVPMMIFLMSFFVWLCVLMVVKWIIYAPRYPHKKSPFCAPSVLIIFIKMVLQGEPPAGLDCEPYMWPSHHLIQIILLFCGVFSIPWLLLVKPIYMFIRMDKKKKDEENGEGEETKEDEGEEESKGEIMLHQGIFTIEYVLGSVSHTASYLRLWALSLAHSQLSDVLWKMVMANGARFGLSLGILGCIPTFFIFIAFAAFTLVILVLMEGLSTFLHCLRLHWVEFMSKFYTGVGYAFTPFSFKTFIERANAER